MQKPKQVKMNMLLLRFFYSGRRKKIHKKYMTMTFANLKISDATYFLFRISGKPQKKGLSVSATLQIFAE